MGFLVPRDRFYRVTDLTPADLDRLGIDTLLLDLDNTLSRHHDPEPWQGVEDWAAEMTRSGRRLILVSNSRRQRVAPFAERLGLPYFCRACKPLPFVLRRAVRQYGAERRRTALVGDQILTDVLGARLAGVRMILLHYIEIETGAGLRFKRALEYPLLKGKDYRKKEHTK